MSMKTASSLVYETDASYTQLERSVGERIAAIGKTQLFTTTADNLWHAYLSHLPITHRQHYNCRSCQRFIERYGGLALIDANGEQHSAVWVPAATPLFFRDSVAAMHDKVKNAKVDGVFYNDQEIWGSPVTNGWTHLSGAGVPVYKDPLKSCYQAQAEKLEEHNMLRHGLAEFPRDAVVQALRVLEADELDRSEKTLGVAKWLLSLHDILAEQRVSRSLKDNKIWAAVAAAPPGWCHIRSTMISTLLDHIVKGLSFTVIRDSWDRKMHPLKYQRPTTVTEGNIEEATKVVEKLGCAASLNRRFAKLTDVLGFVWRPRAAEPERPAGGVFDHLRPGPFPSKVKEVKLPSKRMVWEKFAAEVLPRAHQISYLTPAGPGPFYALVTAVDPEAPAIVQWDGLAGHVRNPVTWYVYDGGSMSTDWGLKQMTTVPVTAIFRRPHAWQEPAKFSHQGEGVLFALAGAKDMRHTKSGGLFPELLKSSFHSIRHTIEAHAKAALIVGKEEGDANGVALSPKSMPLGLYVDGTQYTVYMD